MNVVGIFSCVYPGPHLCINKQTSKNLLQADIVVDDLELYGGERRIQKVSEALEILKV
jgi:hypothetical protein